jgi:hypothetical protein
LAGSDNFGRTAQAQAGDQASRPASTTNTISFSGYEWEVRSGTGGPGPNRWKEANAWVDENGYLHLKISKVGGLWYCAQVQTLKQLGFGTYQFQVRGRVDELDPNIVLGLFNYTGPDGTNEIDIELSRWGDPDYYNGSYTVWPAQAGYQHKTHSFSFSLAGWNYSTYRFRWSSTRIFFQSLYGRRDDNRHQFASWFYGPRAYLQRIPQNSLPAYINLWLMLGRAPTNGKGIEVVISSFKFMPAE